MRRLVSIVVICALIFMREIKEILIANNAESYRVIVTRVIDGDTVDVQGQKQIRVRLACVDAPELDTAAGTLAKRYLKERIEGRYVIFQPKKIGRYGRVVGDIRLPGAEVTINHELVSAGKAAIHGRGCGFHLY